MGVEDERGAAVAFENVTKGFGNVEALVGFSCEVAASEFLTLLGPSGSGKTTALNIVAGFLNPDSGEVRIADRPLTHVPTERRNVGMVFQHYSLFPHMNVADNVAFPLRMRGVGRREARNRAGQALELVRLDGYGNRMPNELSGGQQQRVAFARAIVFEPKVLLMDEPLAALDLKLREAMQLEIKHYQEQIGCTVIYVTHDQGEALTLSDHIVVMNNGRLAQMGSPQEIYDRPQTRFVAEFIGQTNILTARPGSGGNGRLDLPELGVEFAPIEGATPDAAEPLFVSLRPEDLRSRPGDGEALIRFPARVRDIVFLGDTVRYVAVTGTGKEVVFRERRQAGTEPHPQGMEVELAFRPHEAVIVQG